MTAKGRFSPMKKRITALLTAIALLALFIPAGVSEGVYEDGVIEEKDSGVAVPEEQASETPASGENAVPFSVGEPVFFGHYPQTEAGTDRTPIEWTVLEVRDGKALLISRYGLDSMPYNNEDASTDWENSSLRSWLNNEFLQAAFTEDEQAAILSSRVKNSSDQHYNWGLFVYNGEETEDRIFLLSYAEAKQHFGLGETDQTKILSRVEPTEYALSRGAQTNSRDSTADGKAAGKWWLRTPGAVKRYATIVYTDGGVEQSEVNSTGKCVRPAFWMNLEPGEDRTQLDRAEKIQEYATVGNIVRFGRYEQDDHSDNGPESIEWVVLDVQDNKALLISQYGLDAKPFSRTESAGARWQESSVRQWLNYEFFFIAFNEKEQAAILLSKVDNSESQRNPQWDTEGGNNTQDRVFLLSYAEAKQYCETIWKNSYNTRCGALPTTYARSQGMAISERYYIQSGAIMIYPGWWWLRSPGSKNNRAACMWEDGSLTDMYVDTETGGVRPAIWLDLDADVF